MHRMRETHKNIFYLYFLFRILVYVLKIATILFNSRILSSKLRIKMIKQKYIKILL